MGDLEICQEFVNSITECLSDFLRTSQMYDPNEVSGNKSVLQNTKKKDCNVSEI